MQFLVITTIQLLSLLEYMILLRMILSWVMKKETHPITVFIFNLTEPILVPFKSILNKLGVKPDLDLSPILLFIFIELLKYLTIYMPYRI